MCRLVREMNNFALTSPSLIQRSWLSRRLVGGITLRGWLVVPAEKVYHSRSSENAGGKVSWLLLLPTIITILLTRRMPIASASRVLRVWPAVVLLVAFWAFIYVNQTADMSMFGDSCRVGVYAVLLFGFLGWWLTRGAFAGVIGFGRSRS